MEQDQPALPPFWRAPAGIALCVALAAVGFYLLTEHTAHLFGLLPYLFILACPLMHLFMHHGHGQGGHGHGDHASRSDDDESRRQR
jgi:hypothetical protein